MSVISLTTPPRGVHNGKALSFVAPCDSTGVTAVKIDNVEYALKDALGQVIADCGTKVFAANQLVTIGINTTNSTAIIQTDAYNSLNIIKTGISVPVASFVDSGLSDYPYKADISISECTANCYPSVTFTDTESEIFAPYCDSAAGKVTIYASEVPSAAVSIDNITLVKII